MQVNVEGELWIPRTMWEKRRQLSGVVARSLSIGRRVLLLSCDTWTTFFGRIDVARDQINEALVRGQIDYMQVSPLLNAHDGSGMDLSRILGQIGLIYKEKAIDQVIVDDVDLMIDLGSAEAVVASMYALLYALKSRFKDIALFSNPLRSARETEFLLQLHDSLAIHYIPHQVAA